MLRALTVLVFACCCFAAWPRLALAQRVLVVRPAGGDATLSEAFNRLRAELILQDFEVQVLDTAEHLSPDQLQEAAKQADAFAGVALARSSSGADADVCIADRVTGKISLRRLAISAGEDSPRVLAVRAVDLLRESLRELRPDDRPPPDIVGVSATPAPPAVRTFVGNTRNFQLSAAGFALATHTSTSNAYGAGLALGYRPIPRLALGVLLVGPLLGARYASKLGTASLRQELGLLRATFNLLRPGRFELGPLLGVGAYHLHAQGEVESPLTSQSATVWSFAGSCGVEAQFAFADAVSLNAALQGLLLTPRPVVAVDTESEVIGQPLVLASLGLGVAF